MTERAIILRALTLYGHTPQKALEIAIDAERLDTHAVAWVNRALDAHHAAMMGNAK